MFCWNDNFFSSIFVHDVEKALYFSHFACFRNIFPDIESTKPFSIEILNSFITYTISSLMVGFLTSPSIVSVLKFNSFDASSSFCMRAILHLIFIIDINKWMTLWNLWIEYVCIEKASLSNPFDPRIWICNPVSQQLPSPNYSIEDLVWSWNFWGLPDHCSH